MLQRRRPFSAFLSVPATPTVQVYQFPSNLMLRKTASSSLRSQGRLLSSVASAMPLINQGTLASQGYCLQSLLVWSGYLRYPIACFFLVLYQCFRQVCVGHHPSCIRTVPCVWWFMLLCYLFFTKPGGFNFFFALSDGPFEVLLFSCWLSHAVLHFHLLFQKYLHLEFLLLRPKL